MQPKTVFAGLACLGLASATPSNLERRQNPGAGGCAERLHVIGAGGANYSDPYAWGRLQSLADSITSQIPGSDAVSLPYDKMKIKTNPQAVPGGVTNLQNYVTQYHAACPTTKMAIIGYSSGAVIMSNGLCTGAIDPGLADDTIVASVLYGDQTRHDNQPYNRGTCQGQNGRLSQKIDPAGCQPFAAGLQSYCDTNDPECCNGPSEDYMIHFVYPKYDQVATDWIQQRLNQLAPEAAEVSSVSASAPASSSTAASSSAAAAATMATSSMEPFVFGSVSSSVPVPGQNAASSAVTSLFSAASSSAIYDGGVPAAATTAAPAAGTGGMPMSSTGLAPFNPNSGSIVIPSFVMVNAACLGALVLVAALAL